MAVGKSVIFLWRSIKGAASTTNHLTAKVVVIQLSTNLKLLMILPPLQCCYGYIVSFAKSHSNELRRSNRVHKIQLWSAPHQTLICFNVRLTLSNKMSHNLDSKNKTDLFTNDKRVEQKGSIYKRTLGRQIKFSTCRIRHLQYFIEELMIFAWLTYI